MVDGGEDAKKMRLVSSMVLDQVNLNLEAGPADRSCETQ